MSPAVNGVLTLGLLVLLLALCYHPLGAWLARTFTDRRHWRVERLVYRVVRVDPDAGQTWRAYAVSVLAFSFVGIAALIAGASETMPLLPGDLLLTGSPPGNGQHWKRFLRAGDVMTGSIEGLGTQVVRCVAP